MKGLLRLLVLFYLLIISGYNYSQILSIPTPNLNKCGSDEIHRQLMQTDAGYAQRMQAFENMVQSIQPSLNKTTGVVYKIPVVVHVMHKGEAVGTGVNVSDEAIRNAIKDLNEMYRKVPGSQGDGNGVDVEIEYSLAVRDPNGNCTNGINRVNMTGNAAYMSNGVNRQATGGISDATLKSTAVWNQNNYYNIWLVSEIDNNEGGSGIQGYAYFASSHGTSLDGAVILSSNFTSGTSTTAAHELGHSLNLYHTFEGDGTGATCPTNSNGCGSGVGDCCGDIPAHRRSSSDCVTGTNACDGVTSRDLFIHNYMDYSSDACQNMLTANQKTRMQAAITGARASFLSPENGGTCMSLVPVTTAGVNFTASSSILCGTGQSVTFTDISSCIPNSYIGLSSYSGITHSWTITNGTNTYTSSLQNPTITFTNTGTFNVTLSVTNAFGTTTLTKPGMIVVTSGPPVTACTPNSTNVGNYWQTIYNTTFNNINSSTSKYTNAAYTNLACSYNTTVTSGSTYSMAISANAEGGSGNEVFEVYIDYNNNGVFSNPSELVFSGVATSSTSATFTTNVTIPGTAVQNTLLRMRVIGETGTISVSERTCGISLFVGDVEDYGVYILSPPCTSPTITATTPSSRCGSGTLTLSATSNTGTVNWYTAATGGTAIATGTVFTTPTLTTTTTYYVDATNAGCTTPIRTAVTASINAIPIVTLTASSSSLCSGSSSTITATGASTYTWLPSGTGSVSVVSPTSTTVYSVTGTSSAGCVSAVKTITIIVNSVPSITLAPLTSTICSGQTSALVASGASTYSWNTGATSNSISVTPTVTTNYTVVGTSAGCSSAPKVATVIVNSTPIVTLSASANTICAGQSVTLTATGASTYSWSPIGSGSVSVVSPTSSVIYTVVGTSSLGCSSSIKTITVTVNPSASLTLTPVSSTICSGQSVTLNASGTTSYSWSTGASSSSITVNPTVTTTYSVIGSNGACSSAPVTILVTVNSTPITTATVNGTLTCSNFLRALNANIAGMNYTWTPPTGGSVGSANTQTTSVLSPGTYSLLVVNPSTSCSYSTTVSVMQNTVSPLVTSSVTGTITCSTNSVSVVASTTVSPVTYLWNGPGILSGNTASTVVVNQPGSYNYTVTNTTNGCKTIGSATVAQNTVAPTVTVSPSQTLTCSSPSVNLSGASTPSNCLPTWSGGVVSGVNSFTATATSANIFTLTVTNPVNGCSSSGTVQVLSNISLPTVLASVSGSLTCSVNSVQVVATSSSSPVSYLWLGAGVLSGANSASATVNVAGVYSVTVTNTLTGCASSATVSVTQNTIAPVVSSAVIGTITCATSTALVRATTSVTPVSYTWAGAGIVSGASTGTIIVNQAGTYNYTVTNTANGCKTSGTRTVTQNTVAPNVIGSVSGTLTCSSLTTNVIATTTSSPVSYTWVGPGIITGASTGTIVVNQPGNYNYTVTSSNNGCKKVGVLTVIQNTIVPSYTNTSISNTICNGGSKILAVNTSSNNSIIWSNGSTSSSVSVTPSVTTVYTTTITSLANGCLATTSSTVNVVSNPVAIVTTTNVSCFGLCDGGASVSIVGGSAPYTYSLMTGATPICQSTDCYSLCAGNYTVVTNDANGCSVSSSLSISQPQALVASATNSAASCSSCSDGNAFATVSGGTAPYTYVWTPSSATTPTLNNISVGCYTVLITDSNGCQNSASTCVGFATGLSSATLDGQVISVYPNPSKAIFNITMTTQLEELQVEVYNAIGQVIILEDYKNVNNISLDMTNVSRGVYYLKVSNNNGNKLFKLILE